MTFYAFFTQEEICSSIDIDAQVDNRKEVAVNIGKVGTKALSGGSFLLFYMTLAAGSVALRAQEVPPSNKVTCEVATLAVAAPLSTFIVEADTQTVTGRLACADPRPAFYNCGHTKQSVWGCKPDCFVERDGSQYVLQTSIKSYSLTGNQNEIRPLLKDRVIVTGELKGDTIRVFSISKAPKKDNPERAAVGTSAP